jgi:peptidoglycan/xylan/chitin deacetylase (PgdA/CDA1 family)
MKSPLHTLGYRFLTRTLTGAEAGENPMPGLTRRGFIAAAATLSGCTAAFSEKDKGRLPPPIANSPAAPVKTKANSGYRTPPVQGPVPRNPDMALRSDFNRASGVTFTRVQVSGKFIAMTFDDGPHPQNTPRLLDMLRARNIKATFYVIGRNVDLYPAVVRRTVAEGHEIGNHTYTHRLLSKLGDADVRQEMARTRDAISRAAGVQPRTMRPPYGGLLQAQRELVHSEFGYPTILWSVDPLDWKRPGPSVVASRIISGTTPGGIVLAHDLHSSTVDAMPAALDGLLRQGYRFVTVSQLLAMKVDPAAAQASVDSPSF